MHFPPAQQTVREEAQHQKDHAAAGSAGPKKGEEKGVLGLSHHGDQR